MSDKRLDGAVRDLVRRDFRHVFGRPAVQAKADPEWAKLRAAGTRLWLDTGDLEEAGRLWNAEFEALTTNNTLLNKEVQKGLYDDLVQESAGALRKLVPAMDRKTLILEIAFILNARHGLRLVEKFDTFVSVELHTDMGNDLEATVAYGRRFHAICPERFYVKVPLTPAGYLAARKLEACGIPINFTLGFSARQNYLAALFSDPSYVNVFMGRLNAFVVDHRLGDGRNVGEKTTLATQRALLGLREKKLSKTCLIGASMRDAGQVSSLAGVDVYTIPPKVAAQYRQSPAATLRSQVDVDPPVTAAQGVRLQDFNASSLWEVPAAFEKCVQDLLEKDADWVTPADLQSHFARRGFADLFPRWSAADLQTITADGKIPVFARWKDRLASGAVGLDALMNVSAFQSFATDQKALDDRIASLL
jgi:transaldolase